MTKRQAHETLAELPGLAKPAVRALTAAGYYTVAQLTRARESELLALHGMGPNAIARLRAALENHGLTFAAERETK